MSGSRPAEQRESGRLEALLRHDRALVLAGLVVLCVLAWSYLVTEALGMSEMAGMAERGGLEGAWGPRHLGYLFVMWAVMMVAMMLPSATPMILLFARIDRNRGRGREGASASAPEDEGRAPAFAGVGRTTALFILGYLLVWTAYSAAAAGGQWVLHRAFLVSPSMVSVSPALSGGLLLAAGAFQFSRLKELCLDYCRSPISFLTTHWRGGRRGALRMGARHGTYCVGCCWALMALLFVLGVMNLLWVAVIAAFVLLEKTVPGGDRMTRLAGAGLVVWGAWLLLDPVVAALQG